MEYFKYNSSFLNTLSFTTSSYTDLDDYLNGVVKNYLNHNYSFLDVAPTPQELYDLKDEIEASYDLMLGDVKPRYVEMLRLSTQQEFETVDEVVSEYGNETQTGSYYEPKDNSAQAQINTNGNLTSWDDDTTTTTRTEHRVLSESAIKDFFKEIKEEVELYFIDYVNLFADGELANGCEFSQEQLDAINSGINATKVAQIQTNKENIETLADAIIDLGNNKQDKLSTAQLDAVNSGIDATLVSKLNGIEAGAQVNTITSVNTQTGAVVLDADDIDDTDTTHKFATASELSQIATNQSNITTINGKIPSQASDTNQLADKNFVNSSIATNTANFIGTFNSVADLNAYSGTKTNNDYAFVVGVDGQGNTIYSRYKWNGTSWLFEYDLNNSSFTSNQWATINSGLTSSDKTTLDTINANYVSNTDYASSSVGGVVKVQSASGLSVASGVIKTYKAENTDIDAKTQQYRPIVPSNLDYAIKVGVTTNTNTLNSTEQANACSWLGALTSADVSNKANTDASNLSSANVTSWQSSLSVPKITKLWENSSPDSAFSSQDVSISNDWDFILITWQTHVSQQSRVTSLLNKSLITLNTGYEQTNSVKINNTPWYMAQARRNYTFKDNYAKITFGGGDYVRQGNSSSTSNNDNMIPLLIVGVKL